MLKARILRFLSWGRFSQVKNGLFPSQKIYIGKGVYIKKTVLIGDITIGEQCKLYHVEMEGVIEIGKYTSIWGPDIYFNSALNPITIGNFCSIAKGTIFQEYNHNYRNFSTYFMEANLLNSPSGHANEVISNGPITVGHDVWIGAQCVIMGGATIGSGAIVAANSVVIGEVPPYAIVGGSPAKLIKYRFNEETRKKLLETEWWNWGKERLKMEIPTLKRMVNS